MSGRKPKHDSRVLRYLTIKGPVTQAAIAKGLKLPVANIYPIIKRMVEQDKVRMSGKLVDVLDDKPIKQPKIIPNEHVDRIAMLKDEIDNIDNGIRSLMITRSYLLRRTQEETANV